MSGRPLAAAFANALAPTARLSGAAFSLSVIGEWFEDRVRARPVRPFAWPVALAGGLGLSVFFAFCYYQFGDFFAHLHAHAAWGRKSPSPVNIIEAMLHPPRAASTLKDYVAAILFFGLGLVAWRKRGIFWAGLVLIPILQPLSSGTVLSMTRIALMSYPAFIEAGELLHNRYACGIVIVAGVVLQILMLKGFVV